MFYAWREELDESCPTNVHTTDGLGARSNASGFLSFSIKVQYEDPVMNSVSQKRIVKNS